MNRTERIRQIIDGLRERDENLSAQQMAQLLAENPDLSPDLEQELKNLTRLESSAPASASSPPGPPSPILPDVPASALAPGSWIGHYKLLRKLGEGGMGSVWMAQQVDPVKRTVALKVIRPGMDSAQILARFQVERQALALMDHPNIAKVLEAGTTETGHPFFVMDLVKGIPVTTYCDKHQLTVKERLELFLPVCQAVQHAHEKGIIHRDLKPSNVLTALYDDRPVPKVIDFGVAKLTLPKLTEHTLCTEVGQPIGTWEYMAPEQADLTNLDIDPRADIYSLGVLLYEVLTSRQPFDRKQLCNAPFKERLRLICEVKPQKPSTKLSAAPDLPTIAAQRKLEPTRLKQLLQGELDRIVMKCLEKKREQRYATVNDLTRDIRHYLDDKRVVKGTRAPYRKIVVGALAAFILVGLIAIVVLGNSKSPSPTTEPSKPELAREARPSEPKQTRKDDSGAEGVEDPQKREILRPVPEPPLPPDDRPQLTTLPGSPDWLADLGDSRGRHWGQVLCVAFSADGRLIASAELGHSGDLRRESQYALHLWDARTLRELARVEKDVGYTESLAFSDDGKTLASLSGELTILLWDVSDRRLVRKPVLGHSHLEVFDEDPNKRDSNKHVKHIAFAPGGKAILAWDHRSSVRRWDLSGREVKEELLKGRVKELDARSVLSADGTTLARTTFRKDIGKTAIVVCVPGKEEEPESRIIDESVTALALSSNGKQLALSTSAGVQLWDLRESPPRVVAPPVWAQAGYDLLTFSRDGTRLAAASLSGDKRSVWVYDLTAREPSPPAELEGHLDSLSDLTFSPDAHTLATCSADHTVRVWDRGDKGWRPRVPFDGFAGPVRSVAFSSDGKSVASLSRQTDHLPNSSGLPPPVSSIALWDVEKQSSRVILPAEEGWYTQVAFAPGSVKVLACGGGWPRFRNRVPGLVRMWEVASGKSQEISYKDDIHYLCFDAAARTFAVLAGPFRSDCVVRLGRTDPPGDDGPFAAAVKTQLIALAPDGKVLALVRQELVGNSLIATVHFFDVTDPNKNPPAKVRADLKYGKDFTPLQMAFTPDGRMLVTAVRTSPFPNEPASQLLVWDLNSQAIRTNADAPSHAAILALAVSPDGRTVATAEENHSVALWDISGKTEKEKVIELRRWNFPGSVHALAFDSTGQRLVTGNANGTLTLLAVPKFNLPGKP
jgi:serine/threonine protein kinase/WD40 repeat protein